MNKIAPETTKVNLDGEIDPQLRIDTMLEQCSRLDPPCVGFITRGHILGFEPFLNCAFVTRLFLTKHGLWVGEVHPQIKTARETYSELQTRWRAVTGTAQQLTDWDTWKKMRSKFRDIQLDDLMREMMMCAADTADFVKSLDPVRRRANRGYQAWEGIYDTMNSFLYQLFAIKTKQEEHAAAGTTPDAEKGHAPMQLVDYRHEIKFLKYTKLRRERIKDLFHTVETHHLRKKREREQEAEDADVLETPEFQAELESIVAPTMGDSDVFDQIEAIELIMRTEYEEMRLVFEYYAAGGEGGSAFDMSIAEFTRYCSDSLICKKTKELDSGDIKLVFDATDDGDPEPKETDDGDEDLSDDDTLGLKAGTGGGGTISSGGELKVDDEDGTPNEPELDEDGNPIKTPTLDEDGNPIDEDDEEEEYSWDLGEGEREIVPVEWVETIVHMALLRYPKIQPLAKRVSKLINDVIKVNACQANTETFRGELSMDEVQKIYKLYKPQLMAIFRYYAIEHPAKPGQPPMEPSMDGPIWLQMMKDSKLMTRKSDVPNDLPELSCREIFNNVQAEEEEDGGGDVGGGADEMIYMEYLEAWGAVACFKRVNPYVPLWKRMEETFVDKLFPPQKKYALARKKKGKK